ncbi:hypothetical protein [Rhizobium sp. MHM7A]|uniref:hypothetical protein n=1 Tax=Rhizobium sp. MHM7A TaxID=2583233 RepID=UPI001106029C|nr:hypothetical protein [Rhizobium sp. MHM7A]TLX16614.1 hypothetical protein FFR93_04540 [Rhizobium sp. MHM7A]
MSLNAIRLGLLLDLKEQFSGLGSRDVDDLAPLLTAIHRFDHITSEEEPAEADMQRRKFLRGIVDIGVNAMGTKPLREEARSKIVGYGKELWKLSPED